MDQAENLRTLAEVAVAFAGFTGIVAVLGKRSSNPWSSAELNTIRTLLHTSIGATLFALLPGVLGPYVESSDLVWRASSGLFTAYHLTAILSSLRHGSTGVTMAPWVVNLTLPIGFLSIVATSLVTLGMFASSAAFIYTLTVFHFIMMSAICFGSLLLRGSPAA